VITDNQRSQIHIIRNFGSNRIVSHYSIWSETNPTIRNFKYLFKCNNSKEGTEYNSLT